MKDLPLFSITIADGEDWTDAYERRFAAYYEALFAGEEEEYVRLRDVVAQWLLHCSASPDLAEGKEPYQQFECTFKSSAHLFKAYAVFRPKAN